MTRTIHLARHGQTEWHEDNRYAGVSDVALTERGRAQAAELGRWAEGAGVAAVVSSRLTRAVETARAVAVAARVPRVVEPDLRESDFGRGEGMTRDEMAREFPDALAEFLRRPATSPLPGGEPGAEAAARFIGALRRVAAQQPEPVLVVAHTTVLRLALCSLLGLPLDEYRTVFPSLDNASVTTIALPEDGAGAALLRFNASV